MSRTRSALLTLAALSVVSCSPMQWSGAADREVYGLLREKEETLFGEAADFDIETPHSAEDPSEIAAIDIFTERHQRDTRKIDLVAAIGISVDRRREYQAEKENLYLAGLELTSARHDFSPIFSGGSTGELSSAGIDGDETSRQLTMRTRAGFSQLLKSGGTVAIGLAQNIFRYYLGGSGGPSTEFFSANLTQPLLRGAGPSATENLTQSERDVAYAIRSFSRFQKRNALDVTSAYFRILEEKDRVRNEYFNYRNLIAFTERATALAEDRLPQFQVDQAKQDELRARNRYVGEVSTYRTRIDDFKLTLGLPVGGDLFVDDAALRDLEKTGLTPLPLDEEAALALATRHRLDLLNEIDQFEDSQRRMTVAAEALKPGLNLFAGLSLDSPGGRTYSNFDAEVYRSRIGIDLDLPLDNVPERNAYRRTRIAFERQLRELGLALDRIQSDIRAGFRGLSLARERYEIQQSALQLANQRVEAVNLLLDTDRAETRDLLEARNAQLSARNALTSALIDYHLTRLELLFDLGVFDPDKDRFWAENPAIPQVPRNNGEGSDVGEPGRGSLISPEELFQEPST
ncbi:outer membrane protein TolC [Haloferula luteola]|uniref:Outer membrane protein TolC n=1 Tax=Haloferula luteola TaxID=595692 RepID=A0A840V3N5_9BACT|nr:TolC family protein [Haloferula luteola]MBB5350264.1 outer membrane protein TolC [Haloferula luteola]